MSDQANSEGLTGSAERGHGRRAVMLGAAAVGAGAVAGMAGSAGAATASTEVPAQKGFVALSRSITVRLPATPLSITQTLGILQKVLANAGHSGCFSGLDFHFTYENEYIVNVDGVVQPEI